VVPHLERDRVEDALSLAALEPSLADCERIGVSARCIREEICVTTAVL